MNFRLLGGSQKNTAGNATNPPSYRARRIGLRTHLVSASRHHEPNLNGFGREIRNNQGKWKNRSHGSPHTILIHAILLWSTMCTLLLMSLWTELKWNGGRAIGFNEIGNTNLAMDNCLWVSGMYSLVGVIATTLIVWRRRSTWGNCTRRTNLMGRRMTNQAQIQGNFLPPPWPLHQQIPKMNETRKWNGWQHPKRRLIVCVEGNIGSGKSTLINSLKKKGWRVYQ